MAILIYEEGEQPGDGLPPAEEWHIGIASRVGESYDSHALLMDFDNPPDLGFVARIAIAINRFRLPKVTLYESSPGSYHAIAFTRRSVEAIAEIMDYCGSDPTHLRQGKSKRFWVLRTQSEPGRLIKLFGVLPSEVPDESSIADLWEVEYTP